MIDHVTHMQEALRLAHLAGNQDEVPVGAVVMRDTLRMGEGYNQNILRSDPTAHAEVMALREACAYQANYRLSDAVIYVTLEPCLMCYTAIVHARVDTLVYGASDPKSGFTHFLDTERLGRFNHRPTIIAGVLAEECSQLIQAFFRQKRERGKRKWLKNRT